MSSVIKPILEVRDYLDNTGAPNGGEYTARGLNIQWQRGPLKVPGEEPMPPNGAFPETVLEAVVRRLEFYQTTRFACEENAEALTHLKKAQEIMAARIARRAAAGTLGTHKAD